MSFLQLKHAFNKLNPFRVNIQKVTHNCQLTVEECVVEFSNYLWLAI